MNHSIALSKPLFELLQQEADQRKLSPSELAEKLLAAQLSAEKRAWQASFEALLARVHARMASFDPVEVEADITLAAEDVKAEHRAAHRPA